MPITVDLYPDAPYLDAQVVKGKKNIWRLDVINGSHTAVTFNDAGKIKLRPQAGNGVIPFEPELWIDRDQASKKRTIYFYCRRDPDAEKDSVCLIETPELKGDAPLQVWSRHHHNRYVFIKLYGRSLVLNSKAPGIWPYTFKEKEAVSDDATAASVIDLVARRGNLDHLVINAHGTIVDDASTPSGNLATCWVGKGLSTNNLHLWDRLKGKVKYIWLIKTSPRSRRIPSFAAPGIGHHRQNRVWAKRGFISTSSTWVRSTKGAGSFATCGTGPDQ